MALVMVVNDEPDLMEACGMALRDLGHDVVIAPHATLAATIAEEKRPDVVLLDLVIPGTSGEEILRLIQKKIDSVPVVVMSASADGPDRARRMEAEAFLVKPFDDVLLGQAVDRALHAEAGQHLRHRGASGRP